MVSARTVLVLGLGQSGDSAARLLIAQGHAVRVVDSAAEGEVARRAEALKALGADVRVGCPVDAALPLGGLPSDIIDGIKEAVVSPGVPVESPWVTALEKSGIQVVSELELGWCHTACPVIAVTGSKGKSTLVKLLYDILAAAGKRVEAGGNYGTPLTTIAARSRGLDYAVAEVSSFQLERARTFRPRVGVLLNIQPDHLDRHGSMDAYSRLKARLFTKMGNGDAAFVLGECMKAVKQYGAKPERWVSFGVDAPADYRYAGGWVVKGRDGSRCCSVEGTCFDNAVTGLAAAAAVGVAEFLGIDANTVGRVIRCFEPLPHRMQEVAYLNEIRFVDDSKATNLAALAAGVTMTPGRVRLIAGGMLKENGVDRWKDTLAKRVRAVYLIGRDAKLLETAWAGAVRCIECGQLERAVTTAFREAEAGDTVLLSPGCASFDQFSGYAERGNQFVKLVGALKNEEKQV